MACSCVGRAEFEQLKERMDQIERRVDELNSEVASLRAIVQQINAGGYVTAVVPDADGNGYTLAFNDGSTVHISIIDNGQQDPRIGVRQDSFFRDVDVSNDEYVLLVLSDGSALKVPKYVALDIVIDFPRDLVIDRWEYLKIPFRIIGTNHDGVSVTALVNGSFTATVDRPGGGDSGTITIEEQADSAGTLVVLLSTPSGTAVVKSATFSKRYVCLGSSSYDLPTDLYLGSLSTYMSSGGGTMELTYFTNTSFRIDTSEAPWISVVQDCSRPADATGTLVLEVEKNAAASRIGTLRLSFDDPQWTGTRGNTPEYKFTVNQGGKDVELGASRIDASGQATVYQVEVRSKLDGLTAFPMDSWMRAGMQKVSDGVYSLYVDMDASDEAEPRYSAVYIKRGDSVEGILPVVQYNYDNRFRVNAMKMGVRVQPENGNAVCLPYTGALNLLVDWGDSIVSVHEQLGGSGHPVRHTYAEPGEYIVNAYGTTKSLSTVGPDGSSIAALATIESVLQWGDCHYIESMENAFNGITTLRSLAPDPYHVFAHVTSFRRAFSGCINLTEVPVDLFIGAWAATDFADAFNGVSLVTGESPFNVVDGRKEHLYERPGVTSFAGCFRGGSWSDQPAIHAAGWD